MTVDAMLNMEAVHRRRQAGWVGNEFVREGWAVLDSKRRVRRRQLYSLERMESGLQEAVVTHVVYVAPGVDAQRGDEFIIGPRTYEVKTVREPSQPIYQACYCEEVQVEGFYPAVTEPEGEDDDG